MIRFFEVEMKKIFIVLVLFLLSLGLFAEKPRIAILDFEDNSGTLSKKLSKAQMQAERKVMSIYFRKQAKGKFIILSDSEQEAIIKKMKKESTRLDRNQVYKIATGMGVSADKILYTTIVAFGRKYTVTSELIDLEREISDEQGMVGYADFDGTQESLREAMEKIVNQLMGKDEESAQYAAIEAKKSKDQEACEIARYTTGPSGWLTYLEMFPKGQCAAEAKRVLDKSLCEHARNENTVEIWQKYLKLHPGGDCEFEARSAIRTLQHQNRQPAGGSPSYSQPAGRQSRDANACKYAKNENSLEAWQDYLDSFPDGDCSFEAKGNIRKLKKEREEQERKAAYLKGRKIGSLIWSDRSSNKMNWSSAKQYCEDLTEGGFDDWRLPTISELKTTIQNCQSGGSSCRVSDSCLSSDCRSKSCYCDGRSNNGGYYSKLGDDDKVWLWSSSTQSDRPDGAWLVGFSEGYVANGHKSSLNYVRCVR